MSDQKRAPRDSPRRASRPAAPKPGAAAVSESPPRLRRGVASASVLGLGVLLFANTWERDFWSDSELRVAAVTLEAAAGGDWVIPRMGGEPELSRPPLVFWLPELAEAVSSADPRWTYRLPVTLCALASLALTCWLGRCLFPGSVGYVAMLIQATTFCFFTGSTWLGGDLVFATSCQLAVTGLALAAQAQGGRGLRWALLGWGGLAVAALSKGFLLGPLLVFGSLLLFLLFHGGPAAVLRGWSGIRFLPGCALFAALVLPWYVAVYLREGADTLVAHLPGHLGLVADSIRQRHPAWYHVIGGFAAFLPWTIFVPLGLYHAKDRMKRSGEALCFWTTLFPAILLSLVPAKEPGDLLVICPFMSLLIAAAVLETGERYSLWEGYLRVGSLWLARVLLVLPLLVFGAMAATYAVDVSFGESWLTMIIAFVLRLFGALPAGGEPRLWSALREPAALAVPIGVLLAAAAVAFFYSFRLRRRMESGAYGRALIELSVVSLCLLAAGTFFYGSANSLASSRGFVEEVKARVGSAPLVLYGSRPAAFFYYVSGPSEHLERVRPAGGDETTVDRLRELARRPERVYVAAEKGDHDLLQRDYPSVTGMWKEVDRGYLDWSREMVLLSNKP